MQRPSTLVVTAGLALLTFGFAATGSAQDAALMHTGHVMDGFRGTPEGQGLLPTAMAEAAVAQTHAGLMMRDLANLSAMQTHAGHVLNALDPSEMENGPGLGYGVKAAAQGVAQHISLAAAADGAPAKVTAHAPHVASAATNTVTRVDRMIELAKGIQGASAADAAAPMVQELNTLAGALTAGVDANGDGTVGWQEGEGGLDVAQTHMGLMLSDR